MRREVTPQVVRHVGLKNDGGMVLYSHLTAANVDRVIREQIEYFERLGQDFEWKTYAHDTPADLRERLIGRGFKAEEPEALMVLDIERAPSILLRPVTHAIRRITDPDQVSDVIAVLNRVWDDPYTFLETILRDDLQNDPEHINVYVAYADAQPVSTAWIRFHDHSQFAGLWGGSTLAEYRGRGLYTALLAIRLQAAQARGVRFLTIDAGPMSQPIVAKYGFQFLTMTQPMQWKVRLAAASDPSLT